MSDLGDKQNQSKSNGTDPLQRLTSLKPPRQLSLGGAKPSKKVFTPNLNVARNKSKGPSTANNQERNHDGKQRDRKNNRNKTFNRNEPRVIKSSGVFSEGLGSVESRASRGASYGSREDSTHQPLQKPTIRIKDAVKIDKELEDEKIRAAGGGDTLGESIAPVEDFRRATARDAPVRLPLIDGGHSHKPTVATKIKQEVIVKVEPSDDADGLSPVLATPPLVVGKLKEEVFEDTDVARLLRSDQPQLILLQLPDSLPGRGRSADDDAPRPRDTRDRDAEADDPSHKQEEDRCTLGALGEGRAGRLRVHRSGRVTMLLGGTLFEVTAGTASSFYQEAVSVGCDETSRSARLVSLGRVAHKLNVAPHWESLFADVAL